MQSTLPAYYDSGVGWWGCAGSVWAKAYKAYDLRWIWIHGDLHKAESAGETQRRIQEHF